MLYFCLIFSVFIGLGLYYEPEVGLDKHHGLPNGHDLDIRSNGFKVKSDLRIAVVIPVIHPALMEITQGFISTLKAMLPDVIVTIFNAQSNSILMSQHIEHIITEGYDLIFTVGSRCSLMAQEITLKKRVNIPIIFAGVSNPEQMGLGAAYVTGVTQEYQYESQCRLLLKLVPSIKTLLLIYDPMQGNGLSKDRERIEDFLKLHRVMLKTLEVSSMVLMRDNMMALIRDADAVLVLKDNTVISAIESIIALCNHVHIPLITSDLASGKKGAALSYGIEESSFGVEAAHLAKRILEEQELPSDLPIVKLNNFCLRVNKKELISQGLKIEKDLMFFIESGKVC
ncbi:MAG TPA: ABC transporter substrate-binding protein [Candidatus Babeliaceae bacterium]|nr:ABC transporter substrate-binding protein [Candidatus Babeliaceae bacterium]